MLLILRVNFEKYQHITATYLESTGCGSTANEEPHRDQSGDLSPHVMTQSVPDTEEKPTPQETPGPHLYVLEHTRYAPLFTLLHDSEGHLRGFLGKFWDVETRP